MEFEFDPAKDAKNEARHGMSLADFEEFDGEPIVVPDARKDFGELRYRAFGRIGGLGHCVVFTWRGQTMRLISFRRAHEKEMQIYE